MPAEIIVALIGLLGSLGGAFLGIVVSTKLIEYRIGELEKKIEKHNSLIERMYVVEGEITELQHDVRDLKSEVFNEH